MSNKYTCVSSDEFIWKSKEIFDLNKDIDNIFVVENDVIIGYITRYIINLEVAKHIDILTGLYKSQYLFYNTYNMLTDAQKVTIIFIDLNNFGYIDKTYGHINGDIILKNIAFILSKNTPSDSYLCRYAGDEFAILVPYGIDECKALAEELLKKIKEFKYPNNISVSASIGIAVRKMQRCKDENIFHIISNIINTASLASSKAKKRNDNTFIIEDEEINAIA
jgi:diguanylate cyclase (GGDEF)-like protein